MSKESEDKVAKLLARKLKVKFKNEPFPHQEWGRPDRWAELCPTQFFFLEVEEGQAHPDTNVLKVWPYLEGHPKHRIFLIQAFLSQNQNQDSSRIRLSQWIGNKLGKRFPIRFYYRKITISRNYKTIDGQKLLEKEFNYFRSKR